MRSHSLLIGFLVVGSSFAVVRATAQSQSGTPQPARKSVAAQTSSQHDEGGERIFQQNCARCHNAPESFLPSISGTIVRHMRVRASLSREDEKKLLHFLNP